MFFNVVPFKILSFERISLVADSINCRMYFFFPFYMKLLISIAIVSLTARLSALKLDCTDLTISLASPDN